LILFCSFKSWYSAVKNCLKFAHVLSAGAFLRQSLQASLQYPEVLMAWYAVWKIGAFDNGT
jgi:hypothetical protein